MFQSAFHDVASNICQALVGGFRGRSAQRSDGVNRVGRYITAGRTAAANRVAPPHALGRNGRGRVVQPDPINPALKALGTVLLILSYDGPLSIFTFNLNLRRYNEDGASTAGANFEQHHNDKVGRCSLTPG